MWWLTVNYSQDSYKATKALGSIFVKRIYYDKHKAQINHHHWAIAPEHTFLETLLTPTQK
jgi:hypothetical protein